MRDTEAGSWRDDTGTMASVGGRRHEAQAAFLQGGLGAFLIMSKFERIRANFCPLEVPQGGKDREEGQTSCPGARQVWISACFSSFPQSSSISSSFLLPQFWK